MGLTGVPFAETIMQNLMVILAVAGAGVYLAWRLIHTMTRPGCGCGSGACGKETTGLKRKELVPLGGAKKEDEKSK